MYNSVIECVKVSNIYYWVKKRLVWACLKGVTLYKTLKEEPSHKNHYDDDYSASITRCTLSSLKILTISYRAYTISFLKLFLLLLLSSIFFSFETTLFAMVPLHSKVTKSYSLQNVLCSRFSVAKWD